MIITDYFSFLSTCCNYHIWPVYKIIILSIFYFPFQILLNISSLLSTILLLSSSRALYCFSSTLLSLYLLSSYLPWCPAGHPMLCLLLGSIPPTLQLFIWKIIHLTNFTLFSTSSPCLGILTIFFII